VHHSQTVIEVWNRDQRQLRCWCQTEPFEHTILLDSGSHWATQEPVPECPRYCQTACGEKHAHSASPVDRIDNPPAAFDSLATIHAQVTEHCRESGPPDQFFGEADVAIGHRE
jgi:hypothetical protein